MLVRVEVTAGPASGQEFEFREPDRFLFGRAPDAHVALPADRFVSRNHFVLEVSPPRCRVSDLGSKNGVFVNGLRYGGRSPAPPGTRVAPNGATSVLLADGDVLRVGETELVIAILESEPSSTQPDPPLTASSLEGLVRDLVREHDQERWQTLVAGYRILGELGRGGMGVVYKAEQVDTGRLLAIKTMRPDVAVTRESARGFLRECRLTQQLRHPNLVEVLDSGVSNGTYFVVLELVDGTDLNQLLDEASNNGQRGLGMERVAPLMLAILAGMGHAHRATFELDSEHGGDGLTSGLVHRDLKPENILIDTSGATWIPKVADFGLAKGFEAAGLTDMTREDLPHGTPHYWAREQLTHYRFLTPATDVFALGAIFVEMLTGELARPGFSEMLAACRRLERAPSHTDYWTVICNHPVPPLREVAPEVPESVAAVVDRALREVEVSREPSLMRNQLRELRYPDAAAFREALAAAFAAEGILPNIPPTD